MPPKKDDHSRTFDASAAIAELRRLAVLSSPETRDERTRAQVEQRIDAALAQARELLEPLIVDGRSREDQLQFLADLDASIEEGEQGAVVDASEVFAKLRSNL